MLMLDQIILADRAFNLTKPDISCLHTEWQKRELGEDNGKSPQISLSIGD